MVPSGLNGSYDRSALQKLAKLLVNYSTEIKKGDRALLDMIDVPDEFTVELIRAVRAAGGTPLVEVRHTRVSGASCCWE
jgi:aminopeptidase